MIVKRSRLLLTLGFAAAYTVTASCGRSHSEIHARESITESEVVSASSYEAASGHSGYVSSMLFASGGQTLISAGQDETIRYWDTSNGRLLRVVHDNVGEIRCLVLNVQQNILAVGGERGQISLWQYPSGGRIAHFQSEGSLPITSIAFSPDDHYLVECNEDDNIRVWDMQTDTIIRSWEWPSDRMQIWSSAFSPDARLFFTGGSGRIDVWDFATGSLLNTLDGHTGYVTGLEFDTATGRLISIADDGYRIWDLAKQRLSRHVPLNVSASGFMAIINPNTGDNSGSVRLPSNATIASSTSDLSMVAVATEDGLIHLLKPHNSSFNRILGGSALVRLSSLTYSSNGQSLAIGGDDGTVRIWNLLTLNMSVLPFTAEHGIGALEYSPDDRYLSIGEFGGTVSIWDLATSSIVTKWTIPDADVQALAFSPDGKMLATGGNGRFIHLWNPLDGRLLRRIDAGNIYGLSFSPKGDAITGYPAAFAWNPYTGDTAFFADEGAIPKEFHYMDIRAPWLSTAGFVDSGSNILTYYSNGTFFLFEYPSGKFLRNVGTGALYISALSPSKSIFASRGRPGKAIDIWSLSSGSRLFSLAGHTAPVSEIRFSPRASQLVSRSNDGTIRLWDTSNGSLTASLYLFVNGSLCVTPDGFYAKSPGTDIHDYVVDGLPASLESAKDSAAVILSRISRGI